MSFLTKKALAFACLSALAALPSTLAHGHIQEIAIGGVPYPGVSPSNTKQYGDPALSPQLIPSNSDQGFSDFTSEIVATGGTAPAGATLAKAAAGDSVTVKWDTWPDSHKGPVMEYMARCPADKCEGVLGADLDWFKISQANFDTATGKWPSESIASTKSWSFKLPGDIPGGQYLLRHEILAMHTTGQPQFYPYAFAVDFTSSGTVNPAPLGKFPAMYMTSNMATTFGIYGSENPTFVVPGIPVYGSGGAAAAPAPAPSSSAAAPSSSAAAPVPSVSAAPAPASSSAVAPIPSASTSSAAAPIASASASGSAASVVTPSSAAVTPSQTGAAPVTPSPEPETPAPIGGNLQAFAGAFEGISAPAVTASGEKFVCDGNTFNFKNDALGRSCDIQRNACLRAANAKPNAEIGATQAKCESQAGECTHSAFSDVRRDRVIVRFAKRAF